MPRFIHKAQDSEGNALDVIGFIITWSFGKSEYNQVDVINAHIRNNLPIAHLQKGQKRIVATKRALKKMKGSGLLREIESNDAYMRFQFCEEFIDALPSGSTFKNLRIREIVRFNCDTEQFSFEDGEGKPFSNDLKAAEIMQLVQFCSSVFTTSDITRYTQKLFEDAHFRKLREGGGVYFIPAQHANLVYSTQKMFDEIDQDGYFSVIEMPDTTNNKIAVKNAFKTDIETKREALFKRWEEIKKEGDKMSRTIFTNDMEAIAEMIGDVELYADLTQDQLTETREMLKEMSEALKKEYIG